MKSLIENKKVISLIGMAKNVGKTTTLNYILKKQMNKKIGLTSIGRDGELKDIAHDTPKPRIYIKKGVIIATTTLCLDLSDFTKQVLETTGFITPLGEVVIVKALSDGFVELAGPSTNEQIRKVVHLLQKHGAKLVLIDGAINRRTIANIDICDGAILCTGANYSSNIDKVIDDTASIVKLLTLPEVDKSYKEKFSDILNKTKACLIDNNQEIKYLNLPTIVNQAKKIVDELTKDTRYLLLNGALTNDFINELHNIRNNINNLTIVVKHGVNCLFSNFDKIRDLDISIKVLNKMDLLMISINPTSIFGYKFNEEEFTNKLKAKVMLPIINVMSDYYE